MLSKVISTLLFIALISNSQASTASEYPGVDLYLNFVNRCPVNLVLYSPSVSGDQPLLSSQGLPLLAYLSRTVYVFYNWAGNITLNGTATGYSPVIGLSINEKVDGVSYSVTQVKEIVFGVEIIAPDGCQDNRCDEYSCVGDSLRYKCGPNSHTFSSETPANYTIVLCPEES